MSDLPTTTDAGGRAAEDKPNGADQEAPVRSEGAPGGGAPAESEPPPRPDQERDQERDQGKDPAAAGGAPSGDEIDLSEGKTLSDFLEEDEQAAPARESAPAPAPEYRSIPNVEKLVIAPPGGTRGRQTAEGASESPAKAPEARPSKGAQPPPAQAREGLAAPRTPLTMSMPASPVIPPAKPAPEEDEQSFGEMFETSLKAKSFEVGQTVKGVIVVLGPEVAFLDIGGKSEATIDIGELKDAEGDIEVEVGETIAALVVSTEGGLKLSRRLARGAAAKEQLAEAFAAGLPVEGRVEKSIKGGYEVKVAGQRAFCPISQIDLVRTADPSVHQGRVYTFRIIEFKEGGKNLILSRRVLQQEEENAKAELTRKAIVPDAVLKGRVVSVREYGAFVDLGGVQGLLHVSEMGWARVGNASEMLKPGDEVTVKVLRLDEQKGRISLGLKQLQPDPWSKVGEAYAVGQVHDGRIVRLQDFGAFVELEPGIEALAHVSTFPPTGKADGWKAAIAAGTVGKFEVLSLDLERKRIGVAMLEEGTARWSGAARASSQAESGGEAPTDAQPSAAPGQSPTAGGRRAPGGAAAARPAIVAGSRLKGKVERHENYGVFIFLAPGRTGLMPLAETATQRGADLRKVFPVGSEIEVAVLEVEPAGKRIRLSRRALLESDEKDDAREFSERRQTTETFGSIGEKLRAALAARPK